MSLDVHYLKEGFTLVVFNTRYVDKKTFIVLNIPTLSPLVREAVIKLFGGRVHYVTNPLRVLHFPLPGFLLTKDSLVSTLERQYGPFDAFEITRRVDLHFRRVSAKESNAVVEGLEHLDETVVRLRRRLVEDIGVDWLKIVEAEIELEPSRSQSVISAYSE
jgi:hypothetical protein